jgi:hypothetical protein
MNMKKTVIGTTLAAFMTVGLPTISHAKDLLSNHAQKADEKDKKKDKKKDEKKKDGEGGGDKGEKSCGGEKK